LQPFALAGKDDDIELFDIAINRTMNGLAARSMVFYGLKGVGKTILLRELYSRAKAEGWIVAFLESDPSKNLRRLLGERLEDVIADLAKPGVGESILNAVNIAWSFIKVDVNPVGELSLSVALPKVSGSNVAAGNIEGDMSRLICDLSDTTIKYNKGVAIFIDEAQDLSREDLRAINMIVHRANQERYRIVVGLSVCRRYLRNWPILRATPRSCANTVK
jgi:hypothetical protein